MTKDQRMQWWRNARFGMFIHFGLYSPAAGEWKGKDYPGAGEWLLTNAKVDPLEYRAELQPKFNPSKFNADEWAQLAKDAGMQYVVITSKHHDGFCLWHSDLTDYDVANTPFKRDIMKELSTAVRGAGLHMGWYHSIMDWTHPDYLPRREWDKRPADPASYPKYVEYMHGQLKELLTRYGAIDVLWFDGEWENTWTHEWGVKTDDFVRTLQPQIIVNNRVDTSRAGLGGFSALADARGDFGTPEQTIPANGMPGKDWETCMTMNDTWGFKASDHSWKSSREMIRMLCDIASKGGNFLMNVGPKGDGTIPQESVERLRDMGAWLKKNGTAIYGTSAGPFTRKLPWGRVTANGNTLYLLVFERPESGEINLPGLTTAPQSAHMLPAPGAAPNAAPGAPLKVNANAEGVTVSLPATLPDANASVVVLELAGPPAVTPHFVRAGADGVINCTADEALTTGSIQFEQKFNNLGFWYDPNSTASWNVWFPAAGAYDVSVEYAAAPGCGGTIELAGDKASVDGKMDMPVLRGKLPARSGWGDFTSVSLGRIGVAAAGNRTVTVRGLDRPGEAFVNLRRVILAPVK